MSEEQIIANIKKNKERSTKFKDKTIKKLKDKMGWSGRGKKEDPIIINNVVGLKPNLLFQTSEKYHFVIKNVNVFKIHCRNTQNITIEDCNIYNLEIEGSYNIAVRNNTILGLRVVYTRASTFGQNRMSEQNIRMLEAGFAEKIQHSANKTLAALITTFSIMSIIMLFYNWIISLLFIGILILIILLLRMFKKQEDRTEGMQQNIILDNIAIEDATTEMKSIIQTYANLKKDVLMNFLPEIIGISIGISIPALIFLLMYLL